MYLGGIVFLWGFINLLIEGVPLFLLRRLQRIFLFQARILVVDKFTKDEEGGAKHGGTQRS